MFNHPFIKSFFLSTFPLSLIYFFTMFFGMLPDVAGTTMQAISGIITIHAAVYGFLIIEHWRKDKIRGVIFNDCIKLKNTILKYNLHIHTSTNLIYGKKAVLKSKLEGDISITQNSLYQANFELYSELRPELMRMLDDISSYYTVEKYISPKFKRAIKHLIYFYALYLKAMYYPIMEQGLSPKFNKVKNHLNYPAWERDIKMITHADIDEIFKLSDF